MGVGAIVGGFFVFKAVKQRIITKKIGEQLGIEASKAIRVVVAKTGDLLVGSENLVTATLGQIVKAADFLGITDFFLVPEADTDPTTIGQLQDEFDELGFNQLGPSPIDVGIDAAAFESADFA